MADHNELGREGEDEALLYLTQKGYTLLARNWRIGHLEIDIVAEWFGEIVFVEVKTRADNALLTGAQAVTHTKMVRIVRAALDYIYKNGVDVNETYLRFDIAEVTVSGGALELRCFRYIENAFSPADVGIYL